MEYRKISKIHDGKFISRYDIEYRTSDGQQKIYEMISRNKNMTGIEDIRNPHVDAVVLIISDMQHEHMLVNREFRPAAGTLVYNFPAGLIDPGETPEQSAARELKEETGLDFISIDDIMGPSYSAIGFSNEKNICIIGTASGTFADSSSVFEEITPVWLSKEDVRHMLKTEIFTARTQAYLYMWSRQ